ncbi:MAG: hypothetical protein ACRBB3_06885 [Alphaproteobacteria bacterium]
MKRFFKKYIGTKIAVCAVIAALFFSSMLLTSPPKEAEAFSPYCCCGGCNCFNETLNADVSGWINDMIQINIHLFIELQLMHQLIWFDMTYWQQYMLPAFIQMGNQLGGVGTQQVMMIGMFIDAKEQMETQRLMQELHAQTNKDYQPSIGMCEFGTRVKSLASSERIGEMNALILSERSLDRFLSNKSTGASSGSKGDITVRLDAFQNKYCDSFDNNDSLSFICPAIASTSSATVPDTQKMRFNKDIDFQRTFSDPWTIEVDMTTGGASSELEEEIFALSNNLYGFDSFNTIDYDAMQNKNRVSDVQKAYLDMRSAVAKSKVAENSFNAIIAMKSEGTVGSREFIVSYLRELGMPPADIDAFVGENPSYHAQMEVLTKKAYQSPLFYTNLYDKPANVERKGVAMQAIGLMQKFDLLKSNLRTEASLSVLLELSVEQLQKKVEDNIREESD